jgi:HEPN domain-containing protein
LDIERSYSLLFIGKKENSIPAPKISSAPLLSSSIYDRRYKPNEDFLASITEKQNSWIPTAYPEYEKLSLREMIARGGGRKTFNSPPPK